MMVTYEARGVYLRGGSGRSSCLGRSTCCADQRHSHRAASGSWAARLGSTGRALAPKYPPVPAALVSASAVGEVAQ
jgi:hypothetical protein